MLDKNITVLVIGYYKSNNLGDDLFKEAFQKLFDFNFIFTKSAQKEDIASCDAVIIGGGSFLGTKLNVNEECFNLIKTKPILYIGVGVENDIHESHLELLKIAKIIAIRNEDQFERISKINENSILIPDLVSYLEPSILEKNSKSILYIPNFLLVPNNSDPNWMHSSWNYFKSEFSQFLDAVLKEGYKVDIFPMSTCKKINDLFAGIEVVNFTKNKNINFLDNKYLSIKDLAFFSTYNIVISQRFHGLILAEMHGTPFISIHHHHKLKYISKNGENISYYGLNKNDLFNKFNLTKNIETMPIKTNNFTELKQKVINILK